MSSDNSGKTKLEELAHIATMLGTPIDFDKLVKAGVLRRKTKYTYELLDRSRLPEYAMRQATAMKVSTGKPAVLTFSGSNNRAQKMYEKITGKKFTPVE
jgi:hypothetical protein